MCKHNEIDVIKKVDHAFIGISHSDQFDLIILVMINIFVKSQGNTVDCDWRMKQ